MAIMPTGRVKPPKVKGKLIELTFRPAEGGALSEGIRHIPRGGQGGGGDFDVHRFEAIHSTKAHAVNHLKNHLAEMFPQGDRSSVEPEATGAGDEE
jgi:hypothetical protein